MCPVSEETKQLMQELYEQWLLATETAGQAEDFVRGRSITKIIQEIAQRAKVSYGTAYNYTRAAERGFASPKEYREYVLARRGFSPETRNGERPIGRKGFSPYSRYTEHLARKKGHTSYKEYLARRQKFSSYSAYLQYLARQKINPATGQSFASRTEYLRHLYRQRGFASDQEYMEQIARNKGFPSLAVYYNSKIRQRQQRWLNRELSDLITTKLKELGRTQHWLAEQLGVDDATVSHYVRRKNLPRQEVQKRLFSVLKVPYQTIDDLMMNLDNK